MIGRAAAEKNPETGTPPPRYNPQMRTDRLFRRGLGAALLMALVSLLPAPRAAAADRHAEARRQLDRVDALRVGRQYAAMESLATVVLTRLEGEAGAEPALLAEAWRQICVSRVVRRLLADTLVIHAGRRSLELTQGTDAAADTSRLIVHKHLGWALGRMGRSPEALAEYRAALVLTNRHPGWGPGPSSAVHYELGTGLIAVGQVDSALVILQRGLVEREAMNAPQDNLLGEFHAAIATVYQMQEKTAEAEQEFARAIRAHEERMGPDNPGMLTTLSRVAAFEFLRGDYARSVDYNRRGLRIIQAQQPVNNAFLLGFRLALAQGLEQLGDIAEARDTYEAIMPGLENLYGPNNPSVLEAWISLAGASSKLGRPERSLEIYRHIRSIFAADSTLDDLPLACASENMAMLLSERAQPGPSALSDTALALARQAETITRRRGMTGVDLSTGLEALCTQLKLHGLRGEWADVDRVDGAIQEILDRFALRENNNSDDVWITRSEVAGLRGRPAEAVAAAVEGARSTRRRLTWNVRSLSDRQALLLATTISGPLDRLLQLAPAADNATVRQAWDELLRARGLVGLEISRRRLPPATADVALVRAHGEWVRAQEALARQEVQLASALHDAAAEALRDSLRAEVDERERRLVRDASAAETDVRAEEVGLDQVLRALRPGQALVGFSGAPAGDGTRRLIAFVARGGATGVTCLELGAVDSLATLVARWKALLGEANAARRSESECRRLGADVARALWRPLAAATAGSRDIYLVPEAPLTGLPWGALPVGNSAYLVEAGPVLHILEAERELVAPRQATAAGGLLAIGGIDFARPAGDAGASGSARNLRSATATCDSLTLGRLEPLPGTAEEVVDVRAAWARGPDAAEPITLLEGGAAAEAEFKRLAPGRRVIHIATHGLTLAATCDAAADAPPDSAEKNRGPVLLDRPLSDTAPTLTSPSPWIDRQVFLAFTGAALARQHTTDENEGLLTAPEVSTLDLRGVDWVVLSACRSAAGASWSRQGVLGMERAFRLAGARTVIASQWSVDDASTRDWMRALYEARATGVANAGEAMTRANRRILKELRAHALSTHPFTWAAFTADGE